MDIHTHAHIVETPETKRKPKIMNKSSVLNSFLPIFSKDIFPIYKHHEETFDKDGIHGVMHISRSVIASYVLANKFEWLEPPYSYVISQTHIIFATAFHDSGRQGNGDDLWVSDSIEKCRQWCDVPKLKFFMGDLLGDSVSKLISKDINFSDGNAVAVFNSDVLEIMRPCTGRGGINGFIKEKLIGYDSMKSFYDELIPEWWAFITITEPLKKILCNDDCLEELIKIIESRKEEFPTIYNSIQK